MEELAREAESAVPTHVGVNRMALAIQYSSVSRPHARGGEPLLANSA